MWPETSKRQIPAAPLPILARLKSLCCVIRAEKQKQQRVDKAMKEQMRHWKAAQKQGGVKLVLTAEERLARQTTQIGKIIRDAMVRHLLFCHL